MATPSASRQVSSRESEPVKECRLVLTTLSGSVVELTMSVAKYDRLEDLEDHVVDYLLASVTDLEVFGRTLDFVHPTTQTYLEDPIWEVLQTNMQFTNMCLGTAVLSYIRRKTLTDVHTVTSHKQSKFQQTWQESSPRGPSLPCHACDVSVSRQASTQLELKRGKTADILGWSGCPALWCELRIVGSLNSQADTDGGGLMQRKMLLPFALPCVGHRGCT